MRAARRRKHAAGPLLEPRSRPPTPLDLDRRRRRTAALPKARSLRRPHTARPVASPAPRHVRQEAGPRSGPSQGFRLISPKALLPLHSQPRSPFPAAFTTRAAPAEALHFATKQLKTRDLPDNRARLPTAWRPRTRARDGAQASPPGGAARALLEKRALMSVLARARPLTLRALP